MNEAADGSMLSEFFKLAKNNSSKTMRQRIDSLTCDMRDLTQKHTINLSNSVVDKIINQFVGELLSVSDEIYWDKKNLSSKKQSLN